MRFWRKSINMLGSVERLPYIILPVENFSDVMNTILHHVSYKTIFDRELGRQSIKMTVPYVRLLKLQSSFGLRR